MSTAAWSPVSLTVVSAGADAPGPTRLLADRVTEAVCRSLASGGARADVEVVELHRLTADLARSAARGHVGLDLREAVAAVAAADGLVMATPVLAAAPSPVFDAFLAVLGNGLLSGTPVLLALDVGSRRQPPDLTRALCGRLAGVHAVPVPTVVVATPAGRGAAAHGDAERLHARVDRAAAELAAEMRSRRR
ncbi:hypothetical protein SUDANB145_03285 [Streptomyces sp. enrichment culture]|uniref:NAD(P)H-dependent oxidoreductase n=1 Tax=Streptomyces sp. enrichment culture TaxID=1795815 RepID=UPI003F55E655